MGIQVVWDDDAHKCVRYEVRGSWSLGELNAARHELEALIAGRQDAVPIIIDLRESQFVPEGVFVHFGNRSYSFVGPKGLMVFVGAGGLVKGLAASYQRIYRRKTVEWQFADDLERARRIVQEHLCAHAPLKLIGSSF